MHRTYYLNDMGPGQYNVKMSTGNKTIISGKPNPPSFSIGFQSKPRFSSKDNQFGLKKNVNIRYKSTDIEKQFDPRQR